jgi:PncC family amidohydrolase
VETPELAARLHRALLARGETVSCAESLTGGGVADLLSGTPGASATYVGGVVSYATRVKRDLLGVTAAQVVSEDCAAQMATGVRDLLRTDWAVSTTGVAGPDQQDDRLTGSVVDQVEGVLTAAMLDPVAARVVRSGLVLTAFTSTGVSELDVDAVCAVPAAVGEDTAHRAGRTERATPSLHLVPEDERVRREVAQDRVEEARRTVAESHAELAEVEETVSTLRARRLQLQGEIDELRRRLATLEDDVDGVDEDLEEAEAAREDAAVVLQEAESELAKAQRALDDLSPPSRRRR